MAPGHAAGSGRPSPVCAVAVVWDQLADAVRHPTVSPEGRHVSAGSVYRRRKVYPGDTLAAGVVPQCRFHRCRRPPSIEDRDISRPLVEQVIGEHRPGPTRPVVRLGLTSIG